MKTYGQFSIENRPAQNINPLALYEALLFVIFFLSEGIIQSKPFYYTSSRTSPTLGPKQCESYCMIPIERF